MLVADPVSSLEKKYETIKCLLPSQNSMFSETYRSGSTTLARMNKPDVCMDSVFGEQRNELRTHLIHASFPQMLHKDAN